MLYLKNSKNSVLKIQDLIQSSSDIKFGQHIRVINFDQYLEFLNLPVSLSSWRDLNEFEKEILGNFNYVIALISDSIDSDEKFNELIKLSNYCKSLLY